VVRLGERREVLVPQPRVHGDLRAGAPVVLDEQIPRPLAEAFEPGPELDRRLLRQPEEKVAEVEPGVQTGEDEAAARVRVGPAVGADVAEIAAGAERLPAARSPARTTHR